MFRTNFHTNVLLIVFSVSFGAGLANANLTTVQGPPGSEHTHAQILSNLYGGAFVGAGFSAPSYTNGTVTATRVDDTNAAGGIGSNLNLVTGAPGLPVTDQQWVDGIAITSAEAKFASFSQKFGYNDGSGYTNLFDVTVNGPGGYNVSGSATHQFSAGAPWTWMRAGTGGTYSSQNSANPDGDRDHMVTYAISGLAGLGANETVWLLFWEDLPGAFNSGKSDRDFNDLVVQINAKAPSLEAVPLPGAVVMGGIGLGMVMAVRRRMGK